MKLLILTQKIDKNDDLLGFFHGWVAKLARHFEKITVVALGVGDYELPLNVKALSLGKEKLEIGNWKLEIIKKLIYLKNFYWYIWRERNNYDAVFIHMNQEYVILGGWLWRLLGKKIMLWRNHPKGDLWADLAVYFSDKVFCTSRFAYVAKFKKTQIMPVGVDTDFFKPEAAGEKIPFSLLFFGRLSPIKKPEVFIEALRILKEKNTNFTAKIVGNAPARDKKYATVLKQKAEEYGLGDSVKFEKGVPYRLAPAVFNQHEIFVNATPSGSFDKMIFEAMACESLVLASNKNLEAILPQDLAAELIFKEGDAADLAAKAEALLNLPTARAEEIKKQLREIVVSRQSLEKLMAELRPRFKD
ncbi:MAG: glycosyltransferase family 4 protein [Candidatus Portnoybacteria bacterium]|nr:glycosyltransferase family 4 protein [Candidatus Portnoybacteria bacterium]MDD4982502.1 glycosyltransferase family 4 protein [Candidatus Portnoybacteria bacterium]